MAPWLTPSCNLEYLSAARNDQASAFIFFLPGGTDVPPPSTNPTWSIDNNNQWITSNPYPIYAMSPALAQTVLTNAGKYSGNSDEIPNSAWLQQRYGNQVYYRLLAHIDIDQANSLPNLWIFLVSILGILAITVGLTSLVLHCLQKRRRRDLERRVISGEVDLQALGLKRSRMPNDLLEKLPILKYKQYDTSRSDSFANITDTIRTNPATTSANDWDITKDQHEIEEKPVITQGTCRLKFDQPSCAICLEDYIDNHTKVRQLSCDHIFHPECIDEFLTQTSAMCPLCKKSTLPSGYCPPNITNAVVRRERQVRTRTRNASRRSRNQLSTQMSPNDSESLHLAVTEPLNDVEMALRSETRVNHTTESPFLPASPQPVQVAQRRIWARRRAEALLGPQVIGEENNVHERKWKKALRRVFPIIV